MNIHHYGVHLSGGIPFLHQSSKGLGVDCLGQNQTSPLILDLPPHLKRLNEPHQIDLNPPAVEEELPDDFLNNQLVDLYLPKPNLETAPQVAFIRNKTMEPFPILKKMAELCSLNMVATVIFEQGMEDQYRNQLRLTNLGPLTLIGVSVKSSMPVYNLTEFAKISYRNLIISGHQDIPIPKDAVDYTDSYNALAAMVASLPPTLNLRALGAHFFKRWMTHVYESNTANISAPSGAD